MDTRPFEQPTRSDEAVTQEIPRLDGAAAAPAPHRQGPRRPSWTGRTRRAAGAAAAIVAVAAAVAIAGPRLYTSTSLGSTTPTTVPAVQQAAPAAAAPAPAAAAVDLVGKGFSRLAPGDDGEAKVAYAVVLRNRSDDRVAVGVTARITFTGRGGAPLKIEDEQLDALLPGQAGAVADDTDLAGATGMRVQVLVGRWAPAEGLGGRLTAGDVRTATVAGKLTTTATLRSTLGRDLAKAEAVAVWYDRAGRILGGHGDGVDAIAAGGTAPVLIDTSDAPAGIARVAVYASPGDLFGIDD